MEPTLGREIWPHRDATTALAIATDRGYDEIVAIIQEEERRREVHQESGSPASARLMQAFERRE